MATSSANISGAELDKHNRETALQTTKGPLYSTKNFVNFGPLTARGKPRQQTAAKISGSSTP